MTELKCPVCKTGNIREYADGLHYACDNEDCPSYDETDEKTFDVLIDTKKKLDLAITELKNVVEDDDFDIYMRQLSAQTTLEQINQKEEQ